MRIKNLALTLISIFLFTATSYASDARFFTGIQGTWHGPGEIVAGKYKGTKFVCTLGGNNPSSSSTAMDIDGSCRVGIFSQPMSANIVKTAGKYLGAFLDGAKGEGMDVTGGRYTRDRLVVNIKRKELDGIMVANLSNPNKLNVTISVNHNGKLIPVIGMALNRQSDSTVTGSVK